MQEGTDSEQQVQWDTSVGGGAPRTWRKQGGLCNLKDGKLKAEHRERLRSQQERCAGACASSVHACVHMCVLEEF